MVNRQDFYPYIIREDGSKYIVQSYDNMCYSVEEYQETHLERFKTYQRDTGKDYNSFLTSEVRNYGRCFITKSARTMREMLDYPTHLKINDPELGEVEGKLIWPEQTKVEWQKIIDFLQSKHPEVNMVMKQEPVSNSVASQLTWKGSKVQLAELIKALHEKEIISGYDHQNQLFEIMSSFFNCDLDQRKQIQSITTRYDGGGDAKFLNELITALDNWNTAREDKNKQNR